MFSLLFILSLGYVIHIYDFNPDKYGDDSQICISLWFSGFCISNGSEQEWTWPSHSLDSTASTDTICLLADEQMGKNLLCVLMQWTEEFYVVRDIQIAVNQKGEKNGTTYSIMILTSLNINFIKWIHLWHILKKKVIWQKVIFMKDIAALLKQTR